jgi:hypothetical protein
MATQSNVTLLQQAGVDVLRSDAAQLAEWVLKDYAVKLRREESSSEDLRKAAELVGKLLGIDAKDRGEAQPTFNVTINGSHMRFDVSAPQAPTADTLEQVQDVTPVATPAPVTLHIPALDTEVTDMLDSLDI